MTATQETPTLDPYRLPRGALPTRHDVELSPDLAAATFEGRVEIGVEVVEPVRELVLNAIDLDIAAVRVDGSDVQWHLEPTTERLVISPVGGLQPGTVSVTISFTGVLNDQLKGFYRSTFTDEGGRAGAGHHPVRGHRRPTGLPLLGRAGPQGQLRGDPRGPRRPPGRVQRPRGGPPPLDDGWVGSTSPRPW